MKRIWKRFTGITVILLALAVLCLYPQTAEAKAPKLNRTKLTMKVGEKKKLKVKNAKKKVTWKSTKPKVVKVSKKGVLTAKKAGSATIQAKTGKKTLKCRVTVRKKKNGAEKASGKCQERGGIYYIRTDGWKKDVKYPGGVLISSKKALQNYYKENCGYYAMAGDFKKTINSFDQAYFKKMQLVVLRLEAGSGSDRFRVLDMDYSNKKYQVKVEQTRAENDTFVKEGYCVTGKAAQWHILIPVPGRIPTDSKIKVKVIDSEKNQYEKTMDEAKLDKDGKSERSLAEYAGIRTLTNAFTAQAVDTSGNPELSGMRTFSYQMFQQTLSGMEKKNPVISPVSAYFALSMAAAGSGGETQTQFAKVLGAAPKLLEKNVLCGQLKKHLLSTKGSTTLTVANSIWLNEKFPVSNDYVQGIVDYFDSEVYSGKIDTDEMKNAVNQWGSEKTHGLIPNLLEKNFDADVVMDLMNAVYLNAAWKQPFEASATREMAFRKQDGSEVRTKYLCGERNLDYVETENAEGAVLPYDDGKTVFLVLRPTDGTGIRRFAENLSEEKVKDYISNARNARFRFYMPKAENSYDINMNQMLINMGLTNAFDAKADFYKMADEGNRNPIYIDRVFQKVKIKIDEKGTEAAAITDIAMQEKGAGTVNVTRTLKLDSPYVYLVVDLPSQTPLFMGVMEDPSEN